MEIVGTLVLVVPAAIVFLVIFLRRRAEANSAAEAEADPPEEKP